MRKYRGVPAYHNKKQYWNIERRVFLFFWIYETSVDDLDELKIALDHYSKAPIFKNDK